MGIGQLGKHLLQSREGGRVRLGLFGSEPFAQAALGRVGLDVKPDLRSITAAETASAQRRWSSTRAMRIVSRPGWIWRYCFLISTALA